MIEGLDHDRLPSTSACIDGAHRRFHGGARGSGYVLKGCNVLRGAGEPIVDPEKLRNTEEVPSCADTAVKSLAAGESHVSGQGLGRGKGHEADGQRGFFLQDDDAALQGTQSSLFGNDLIPMLEGDPSRRQFAGPRCIPC